MGGNEEVEIEDEEPDEYNIEFEDIDVIDDISDEEE